MQSIVAYHDLPKLLQEACLCAYLLNLSYQGYLVLAHPPNSTKFYLCNSVATSASGVIIHTCCLTSNNFDKYWYVAPLSIWIGCYFFWKFLYLCLLFALRPTCSWAWRSLGKISYLLYPHNVVVLLLLPPLTCHAGVHCTTTVLLVGGRGKFDQVAWVILNHTGFPTRMKTYYYSFLRSSCFGNPVFAHS